MTSNPKSELIFISILIPYAAGIAMAYTFQQRWPLFWLVLMGVILLVSLIGINTYYQELKAYHFKAVTGCLFHLLFFLMGGIFCMANQQSLQPDYFTNRPAGYFKVIVNEAPQLRGNIIRFKAMVQQAYQIKTAHAGNETSSPINKKNHRVNQAGALINKATHLTTEADYLISEQVSGMLMVAIRTDTAASNPFLPEYGDELIIPANYSAVSPPANPSEFDFKAWLATQNIYHQTFLKQAQCTPLPGNSGNPIIAFALKLRTKQVSEYSRLIRDQEAVALASTLILGDRAELSKETLNIYSKTGTIHALSVSGMHVGLIYMLLNGLLSFLNYQKQLKILKLILLLSVIWYYALFTGFSPAVLRSVIMLSVFMIAKSFARPANSYNIVAFTAFSMLLYQPFLIWDVGFQLSFLAVVGLIYLQPKIQHCWYIENKWLNKLWGMIAMSLAAQLFTFPSSIYYFHQFPVYFLISNLFITLPITLLMYLGIIVLFPGFDFLAPIVEWLIHFTNRGLDWMAKLPFSSLSAIWISRTEFLLLSTALILLIVALDKSHKRLLFASLSVFLGLQSMRSFAALKAHHQQEIIVFKLPKGQAVCHLFSNNALIYTDLKPEDQAFLYFIQPALSQHKITHLTCIPK